MLLQVLFRPWVSVADLMPPGVAPVSDEFVRSSCDAWIQRLEDHWHDIDQPEENCIFKYEFGLLTLMCVVLFYSGHSN